MTVPIGRRELLAALGGAASWPLVAQAQQPERVRRIGVLTNLAENDPEERRRIAAFLRALQKLGWRDGDNVRIDYRVPLGKVDNARKYVRRDRWSFRTATCRFGVNLGHPAMSDRCPDRIEIPQRRSLLPS